MMDLRISTNSESKLSSCKGDIRAITKKGVGYMDFDPFTPILKGVRIIVKVRK